MLYYFLITVDTSIINHMLVLCSSNALEKSFDVLEFDLDQIFYKRFMYY